MKIALITDTHFGARNDSLLFNDFFKKFYEDIFFPTLKERNIKKIIHLGDVVDRRKFINFKTLNSMKEILFTPLEEMGCDMEIIVGNHDIYYKNTLAVNSMHELTKGMSRITVYNKPTEVSLDGKNTAVFLISRLVFLSIFNGFAYLQGENIGNTLFFKVFHRKSLKTIENTKKY